jgi:TRAP-type C4-dicarboxylate transport system permease small subunit
MSTPAAAPTSNTALNALETLCLVLAGAALVGVIAAQGWQVFSRYVLNAPPSWTDPLSVTLMAFAAMFGAAVAARRGAHFAFTNLGEALPGPLAKLTRAFAEACMAATGAGLAWLGGVLAANDWSVKIAGAPLPAGMQFLPLCIGGALIAIFAVERTTALFTRQEPRA